MDVERELEKLLNQRISKRGFLQGGIFSLFTLFLPSVFKEAKPFPSVSVKVENNFEGVSIWIADQFRLNTAGDYVFREKFGQTSGLIENTVIPRCNSDESVCFDVSVNPNLNLGMKLIFTEYKETGMTPEESQRYKEGVPVYSEARARYDVTPEGQLTMEVFSLRSTKNYMYAARASYALQQFLVGPGVNVLSLPYPFIFKTIMGDLPKTQGGNGEYNPAIQAEFE